MEPLKCILTMPRTGISLNDGAARGFYLWPSQKYAVHRIIGDSSASNFNFNRLWCEALNLRKLGPVHYFAMIHSDIDPEMHWLDILIDELRARNADVISAVVPLKSDEGVTSTAVDDGNLWHPRRLTMTEIMRLPETFDDQDVRRPLLVNNGLWVCDFTKPWVEDFAFETLNRIGHTSDGIFVAQTIPEDWLSSRKWHDLGLKVCATRKVKLKHDGNQFYSNQGVWGEWEVDEGYYPEMAKQGAEHDQAVEV